jgi:hypothetical protein
MDFHSTRRRGHTSRRIRAYSQSDMQMALDAVMMGTMNPNRASQVFGVPRQTIVDRLARLKKPPIGNPAN